MNGMLLHAAYFAVPHPKPNEQFFYFTSLFAWLMRRCGFKFQRPDQFDDPNSVTSPPPPPLAGTPLRPARAPRMKLRTLPRSSRAHSPAPSPRRRWRTWWTRCGARASLSTTPQGSSSRATARRYRPRTPRARCPGGAWGVGRERWGRRGRWSWCSTCCATWRWSARGSAWRRPSSRATTTRTRRRRARTKRCRPPGAREGGGILVNAG